jgi:hypothetical protein
MQRRCKHAFPPINRLCFLRGPCKVVIRKSSAELVEFRDSSLSGCEFRSRGIELSWQLQYNGKKGIRLWRDDFLCYLKLQEVRCQVATSEDSKP